jgi:hypothetical protein
MAFFGPSLADCLAFTPGRLWPWHLLAVRGGLPQGLSSSRCRGWSQWDCMGGLHVSPSLPLFPVHPCGSPLCPHRPDLSVSLCLSLTDSKMLLTGCDDMHSNLYDVHSGGLIDSFAGVCMVAVDNRRRWLCCVHCQSATVLTMRTDTCVQNVCRVHCQWSRVCSPCAVTCCVMLCPALYCPQVMSRGCSMSLSTRRALCLPHQAVMQR